jgi:hypothetical protein
MAEAQTIWHGDFPPYTGWFGQNVGMGPDCDAIDSAFMASPEHRGNILDPHFTKVGVGTAFNGDTLYVTENFEGPAASAKPKPRPKPRPKPVAPKPKRCT